MADYLRFREKEISTERGKKDTKRSKAIKLPEDEKENEEEEEEEKERPQIYFSKDESDSNAFMSPYYDSPFTVRGVIYKTIQHYYQAQKFLKNDMNEIRECITNAKTPAEAKEISKENEGKIDDSEYWKEWKNERRLDVMRRAIKEKFEQHPDLRQKLFATGNIELIENEDANPFW